MCTLIHNGQYGTAIYDSVAIFRKSNKYISTWSHNNVPTSPFVEGHSTNVVRSRNCFQRD